MDGLDQITQPISPPIFREPVNNDQAPQASAAIARDQKHYREPEVAKHTSELLAGRELATRYLQLEEPSRLKSAFLANMSHELRTPLNAIIGFSRMLDDGLLGELSAQQKDAINDIIISGNRLQLMIEDILDLSQIEAGEMALELDSLQVAALVQAGLQGVRELAMKHHLRLVSDVAEGLATISLDGLKVKQILYSLLSNAVKFTPDGGEITVTARCVKRQAEPDRPFEPYLELAVSDTGIGISSSEQEWLFQPFTPMDSSLARRHEGTGLGLAMVKQLAQLHGGAVAVESTPDKGSTFTVWIPWRAAENMPFELDPVPAAAPARELPAGHTVLARPPVDGKRRTVLVVDDDPKAVKLLATYLESTGYRILTACGWQDGIDLARSKLPDLIVLDLMMPEVNGFEIVEALKRDMSTSSIPIVIVTAKHVTSEDRARLGGDVVEVIEKSELNQGRLVREIGLAMAECRA